MSQSHIIEEDAHQALSSLLPWYAQNTLNQEEHARVEAHLAVCELCRQSLTGWRTLAGGVKTSDEAQPAAWAPSSAHFAQLSAKLDALEVPKRVVKAEPRGVLEQIRAWFNLSPPGMRMAFALQACAIVALAGVLWRQAAGPQTYETLSRPVPAATAAGELRVVFNAGITEAQLRAALQEVNASIVAGPSALAVYTLQLSAGTQAEQALAALRANPSVRFAELNSAQR